MMSSQYAQRQTVKDSLAEWTINDKGEHYINVENALIFDEGFKQKLIDVFNNKYPEAADVEEQESRNAFNYNGQTFHVNQFKGRNGKMISTVRKGPSTRPDDGILQMPENFLKAKSSVFGTQTTFSGGNKQGGGNKSWKPWNNKSQNNNNLKRVAWRSAEEIDDFLRDNPDYVKASEQHHSPKSNLKTGQTEYCCGIPA